jgi:signal transduction histidine kinase
MTPNALTNDGEVLAPEAQHDGRKPPALPQFAALLALAAVYFASAKFGLTLAFVAEQVSPVWPPTGIALAAVLLFGYRAWPGIALGAFFANVTANESLWTAGGIALGNTMEAVLGAWFLKQFVGFDNALERVRDAIGLILLGGGLSTMVSATIGVTSLCLGKVYLPGLSRTIEWSDFGSLWWTWWLGDCIGAIVVTPALLTWASGDSPLLLQRRAEVAGLIFGLAAASWLAFLSGFTTHLGGASLAYIVFPFIIWSALRLGQAATTTVTLVAAGLTIWATLNHLGPFGNGTIHERLLLLQVFMGVVAVTALVLGAALAERRRGEAELRKSGEALREADRRKDEFLAMLAHELRNPLAPIRAGVDVLRIIKSHDQEASTVVDMLDRQVQQLSRLVDDLLDVSRVTRGKIRLQFERIDLRTVVTQAMEMTCPLFEAQNQTLTFSMPSQPLMILGDATRLTQVFANLLNNAAKYSERGDRITLNVEQESDQYVVRVRDTGQGIASEVLPHVFDLFVQGDRSLTRSAGGLGIGLTLVRRLVEMHGGSVRATSEGLGKGSEFIVRLPAAPDESLKPAPPEPSSPRHEAGAASS